MNWWVWLFTPLIQVLRREAKSSRSLGVCQESDNIGSSRKSWSLKHTVSKIGKKTADIRVTSEKVWLQSCRWGLYRENRVLPRQQGKNELEWVGMEGAIIRGDLLPGPGIKFLKHQNRVRQDAGAYWFSRWVVLGKLNGYCRWYGAFYPFLRDKGS